jgi:hypothetical protein
MYRWLKDNNQIKPDTCFYYLYRFNDHSLFNKNFRILEGSKGIPISCTHAILFHDNHYIDCSGIVDLDEYRWLQKIDSEDFILKSVNNIGYWNEWFNRKNVKEIAKKLSIDLSDILI